MALLSIEDYRLELPGRAVRPILDGVDLEVAEGEMVGLVGESGSGKSVTARAVLGLTPRGCRTSGRVRVGEVEVTASSPAELRRLRASAVSMVFQDPRAGINPIRRIGDFLTESAIRTAGWRRADADARALELLAAVGMPDPDRHLHQYPHELSGGMLQRVMIAAALMTEPRLLLCDEPTTALDVTTQAEILTILTGLQADRGMGLLFITHDLDLAAAICDRVYVMYAGQIVESAPSRSLFAAPRHPYTAGLLASSPDLQGGRERLVPISGASLSLHEDSPGCRFAPRCEFVVDRCRAERPVLAATEVEGDAHQVSCWRADEITAELAERGRVGSRPAGGAA